MTNRDATAADPIQVLVDLMLRRWRLLAAGALLGAVLCGLASYLLPRTYGATALVVPSSRIADPGGAGLPSGLRDAGSLMGLSLGGSEGDPSPLFRYLLKRHDLAEAMLDRTFTRQDSSRTTLRAALDPDGRRDPRRDEELRRRYREAVRTAYDEDSGVTRVSVELGDPVLAAGVANAAVAGMDAFHRGLQQDSDSRLMAFLEERLAAAAADLDAAEDDLRRFREQNRSPAGSPSLLAREARLMRAAELETQVFINLTAQTEAARLDVLRNLPALVVIEEARPVWRPVRPNRPLIVLAGFLTGFALVLLALLLRPAGAAR